MTTEDARIHVAWLLWCLSQGYANPADRACLTNWLAGDPATLHPDDAYLQPHLLAMADEILAMARAITAQETIMAELVPPEAIRRAVDAVLDEFFINQELPVTDPAKKMFGPSLAMLVIDAAGPLIRANERERIRRLALSEAVKLRASFFSPSDTIAAGALEDFAGLLGGEANTIGSDPE